jgi:hypothetical protein
LGGHRPAQATAAYTRIILEPAKHLENPDDHCTATHNYQQRKQQQQLQKRPHANHQQRQVFQIPKLGHRKFAI